MSISLERQIDCVRRELLRRKTMYPPKVKQGLMTEHSAMDEIGTMTAVMYTLLEVHKGGLRDEPRRADSGKD